MDLDDVADRLYAAPPEEFVALRTEAVKQARAAKDKALVAALGKLRRPTRTAWLVNLLARGAATELEELLALGDALREAQRTLSGADLRRLSTQRRRAVDALADRAVALGREQGYEAPDSARQEVSQTLQAALAEPDVGDQVRRGVLAQATSYGGFGTFGLADAAPAADEESPAEATAAPAKTRRKSRSGTDSADDGANDATTARRAAAQAEVEGAEHAEVEAQQALTDAEGAAEEATRLADELADRIDALRAELAEVEEAEREARSAARAARKAVGDAEETRDAARQAAEQAHAALRELEEG